MLTMWCILQVIKDLEDLYETIRPEAPMRVVHFSVFENLHELPRSSHRVTVDMREIPGDSKLVFISHRWLRPWTTREECEQNKQQWDDGPHPDDAGKTKYKLLCSGVRKLAEKKEWDIRSVYLWLDFCGVEQDDAHLQSAGIESLLGYISVCDVVLIPCNEVPNERERTVDKIPGGYGPRAWTRLESMCFYTVWYSCDVSECAYAYAYVPECQ
jgi:hypothetical protein